MNPTPRKFLSKAELTNALGVSLPTVNRYLAAGAIKSVKLGGRVLIPATELERLLAEAR